MKIHRIFVNQWKDVLKVLIIFWMSFWGMLMMNGKNIKEVKRIVRFLWGRGVWGGERDRKGEGRREMGEGRGERGEGRGEKGEGRRSDFLSFFLGC